MFWVEKEINHKYEVNCESSLLLRAETIAMEMVGRDHDQAYGRLYSSSKTIMKTHKLNHVSSK